MSAICSDLSIEDAIGNFFSNDPDFIKAPQNEVLWRHDMLHTLLGLSWQRAADEERVSIVQAVLMKSASVNTTRQYSADYGTKCVTLTDIHNCVLPSVRHYLQSLAQKNGRTNISLLDDAQIEGIYLQAGKLEQAFALVMGQSFCTMPREYLSKIRIGTLRQTLRKSAGGEMPEFPGLNLP